MALGLRRQMAISIARFEAKVTALTWQMVANNIGKRHRKPRRECIPATPDNVKEAVWKDHLLPIYNDRVKWTRSGKTFYRCLGPHDSLPDTYIFHLVDSPSYRINVKFTTLLNRWKFTKP